MVSPFQRANSHSRCDDADINIVMANPRVKLPYPGKEAAACEGFKRRKINDYRSPSCPLSVALATGTCSEFGITPKK